MRPLPSPGERLLGEDSTYARPGLRVQLSTEAQDPVNVLTFGLGFGILSYVWCNRAWFFNTGW
jgi:hypothetical protein